MAKVVFDIETIGFDLCNLSESQQEYLLRYIDKEKDEIERTKKIDEVKRNTSLYPFTGKVVVIGMLNTESCNSMILYESVEREEWKSGDTLYCGLNEKQMLEKFWSLVTRAEQVISFNGRCFDLPFLMLRSAILKIAPSLNFLTSRYNNRLHIDLLEELTFHGLIRKFNLDFYCNAFGIDSPKSGGICGMDIKELYKAGKVKEIAVYCGRDVKATYELYCIWKEYLNFG